MTIHDIAKEACVSISSVSRFFNHPELLSEETRKKISNVLDKNSFIPNQMARGLSMNTAKTVGIMMSDIQHQRFSAIAYNLERTFFDRGYNTLFCNIGDDWRKTQQYLYMLASKRVDAVILIGSIFGNFDIADLIMNYIADIPVITSDIELDLPNCYSVTPDHKYGMREAIQHLTHRGHKHIAFVASTNSVNTNQKIDAFYRTLMEYNLPLHSNENVIRVPLSRQEDPELNFSSFLESTNIPYTGLIFSTDQMASRAVSSFTYHGHRVPDDYAVIGYDNSPYALCCQPPLTCIDVQTKTIARVITNLVSDLFDQREVGNHIIIKPKLVIRSST